MRADHAIAAGKRVEMASSNASTTAYLALLARKLAAKDYNPDVYVKEIAQRCVGGHELHQQRNIIKTLSEDTNSQLKRNVYQNYGQFIETAKEIAFLESEMYQLAHMITEQRNLLHELMDASVLGVKASNAVPSSALNGASNSGEPDKVQDESREDPAEGVDAGKNAAGGGFDASKDDKAKKNVFEEGRRRLYDLLEKVEGCSNVMDVPSRYLLFDGDLVELEPSENTALHRVHGYIMNDSFMVAQWLPNRRGPVRFKFLSLYELDSLAVVNVRDFGSLKNTFKLMVFPETRLFQCANSDAKQAWLSAFMDGKRCRQKQHDEIAIKRHDTLKQREAKKMKKKAMLLMAKKGEAQQEIARNALMEADEPAEGDISDKAKKPAESNSVAVPADRESLKSQSSDNVTGFDEELLLDFELPEWLQELADDLEVFIAQREFEQAAELVRRATIFCEDHSDSALVREASVKLKARKSHLIEILSKELGANKSTQGGPRASRRAVDLLVMLGRSTLACDLFLQHRSAMLQSALKNRKMESATVPFIQRQCVIFFDAMLDSCVEFQKAFRISQHLKPVQNGPKNDRHNLRNSGKHSFPEENAGLLAYFLLWVEDEMNRFCTDRIERQIFTPATPLETISICIEFARSQVVDMSKSGLDLISTFDSRFRRQIERSICEHRDKHVEAVKLRSQEDRWEPINCFNKAGLERFAEEMASAGIPSIRALIYDDCWVALTRNTSSFALSYLNFANSLLRLFNPSTRSLVNESLVTVFHSHLRHMEQAVRSDRIKNVDPKFVQQNAEFLLNGLLTLIEQKYQEKTESDFPKLAKLKSSYGWLKDGALKPSPAAGSGAPASSRPDVAKYADPNYV